MAYSHQLDRLKPLSRVAPDLAEQVRAVMVAKNEENAAQLERMFAEEEARQEAFGLAAAEREKEATGDAEEEALIAICACRCSSVDEARLKAEYLLTTAEVKDNWDERSTALLQSFAGTEVRS